LFEHLCQRGFFNSPGLTIIDAQPKPLLAPNPWALNQLDFKHLRRLLILDGLDTATYLRIRTRDGTGRTVKRGVCPVTSDKNDGF
jgi:hypothetical protein